MKKTILVMGAICMPAMAFAQNSNSISESSVRIYGVGDLGIAHYKTAGKSKQPCTLPVQVLALVFFSVKTWVRD